MTKYSFSDPKTYSLIKMAEKVAKTDVTVFIHGPTGTGKEVISNYIHQNSVRSDKPFVAINCAAIPENMLEAMLLDMKKVLLLVLHQQTKVFLEQQILEHFYLMKFQKCHYHFKQNY